MSYHQVEDRRSVICILVVASLGMFSLTVNSSMVSSYIVNISEGVSASVSQSSWLMVSFLIGMVGMMVVLGKMDEYGKIRKVFTVGLLVYITTLLMSALSTDFVVIAVLSFFQGVGASVLAVASSVLIVTFLPGRMKGTGMGVLFAASGLGFVLGPVIGGIVVNYGWQCLFLSVVPSSVAALIAGLLWIPRSTQQTSDGRINMFLAVVMMVVMGGVIFLIQSVTMDVDMAVRAVALVVVIIFAMVLIRHERRSPTVFNPVIFKNRWVMVILVVIFISTMVMSGAQYLIPFYLRGPVGLDSQTAGIVLSVSYLATFILSFYTGRYCDRRGCKVPLLGANVLKLLFCVAFVVIASMNLLVATIVLVAVLGASSGLAGTSQNTALAHNSHREEQSEAATFGMVAMYLGSSVGIALYNTVATLAVPEMSGSMSGLAPELVSKAFGFTSVFGAVLCVIVVILVLMIPNIDPSKETVE